jgi:hypothetical protein
MRKFTVNAMVESGGVKVLGKLGRLLLGKLGCRDFQHVAVSGLGHEILRPSD